MTCIKRKESKGALFSDYQCMRKLKAFASEHFEGTLLILIFLGVLAIAFLVHYKFSFLNFFFLPVILSGYFLGKKRAVLTAVFCILVIILYLVYFDLLSGSQKILSLDAGIQLFFWGGFLILTGGFIGYFSEQREMRVQKLREAYIGGLEIMFKYLECADERKTFSLRVASLAGKIAAAAGLGIREMENVKSAAMLSSAGELDSSSPLYVEMSFFLRSGFNPTNDSLKDREKVMLKATASLLEEVEPLLNSFFHYYVKEAHFFNKDLAAIPIGSSILALAHIYNKIESGAPPFLGKAEFKTLESVKELSGITFHTKAVRALVDAVSSV